MVDAEEDPRFAGALDDAPERGNLLRRRRRQAGLPEARDPDRAEAGFLELVERRPWMANGVVDCADEEGLVVAAATGERQRGEGERTENGVLARTTTTPGRVACTNVTESL